MKRILYGAFFVGLFSLCSCSQSIQEKADMKIQELMQNELNDPSTYEPVETTCDSLFYSIYFEKEVRDKLDEASDLLSQVENIQKEGAEAKEEFEKKKDDYEEFKSMYNQGHSSSIKYYLDRSKEKFNAAKEKLQSVSDEFDRINKSMLECAVYFKDRYEKSPINSFYGWRIIHKYRCKSQSGNKILFKVMIMTDKNMDKLLIDNVYTDFDFDFRDKVELLNGLLGVEAMSTEPF